MDERLHYQTLYEVQDKVLEIVGTVAPELYLSGGTALSRFYLNHRYSDDLDFFTSQVNLFSELFKMVLQNLGESRVLVDSRDFKRVVIERNSVLLKLDFVADHVPRIGLPVLNNGFFLDTVRNILSNKISAILGRDEPRDIADVLAIARNFSFSWGMIVEDTKHKAQFELSELLFRLTSFPLATLSKVPYRELHTLVDDQTSMGQMISDVQNLGTNMIATGGASILL